MRHTKKIRIDALLLEKGLCENTKLAQAIIMAGQVRVDNETITKSGALVKTDSEILILKRNPYVSRGGLKLEAAIDFFKISVQDKVCMDVGASTGGFTDCLIKHGARKVFAIDVGHNQLHERLKNDAKVVSIEGVNFRYFSPELLKQTIEFATIDVSFISLEKILPAIIKCLGRDGRILALVKPQFEVPHINTVKGVVKDNNVRIESINRIRDFAGRLDLECLGGVDSTVKGPKGNIEHFLYLGKKNRE